MNIDPRHTSPGKGPNARPIVRYAGLLDTATSNGLRSITTELLHLDLERKIAVVKATVSIEVDGVVKLFEAIGDASPENAGQIARDAWIRMADTRARARALRDAINVADCTIEADEWDNAPDYAPAPPARPPAPRPPPEPTPIRPVAEQQPEAAPPPAAVPPDAELGPLLERYGQVVFDAESIGLRAPASTPTNAVGLTRAIESLEGQIRRARAAAQPPRTARR